MHKSANEIVLFNPVTAKTLKQLSALLYGRNELVPFQLFVIYKVLRRRKAGMQIVIPSIYNVYIT
jgi:hypothetical protein